MPSSLASLVLALSIAGSGVENNSSPRYIPPRFLQVQAHSEHPIDKAMGEYNNKNLEAAITILEDYTKKNPNDAVGRETLGGLYFLSGMFKEAAIQFNELIRLRPKDENSYFQLIATYFSSNNQQAAGDTLDNLLRINPSHKLAHSLRGRLYLDTEEKDKALPHFEKGGKSGAIGLAKYYINKSDLERAQSVLKKALKDSSTDEGICYYIGINSGKKSVYSREATADEAIKALLVKIDCIKSRNLKKALKEFSDLFPLKGREISPLELFEMYMQKGGLSVGFGGVFTLKLGRPPPTMRQRPFYSA